MGNRNEKHQMSQEETMVNLKETQNKYKVFVENAPYGVFLADNKGNYLEVNQAAAQITGYSVQELLKMNLKQLIPKGHEKKGIQHFEQLKRTGKACSELKFVRKDGTQRWWTVNAVKLNDQSFLGFAQDITEEKNIRQTIAEKEQLFQAMLNAIPDMVSVHDVHMNIIYSNWNGFAAVEPSKRRLHTKCYRTYRGFNDLCPDCQAKKVIQTKRSHQAQACLPNGTWVEVRVIPIFESVEESEGEKKVKYFLEWVRDITAFKKKEEELQLQKEELSASNEELEGMNEEMRALNEELMESEEKANKLSRAKSEFLANMSHELRTPLNGILGFSKLMKQTKIDEEQLDYLECVIYSGETLLTIINDILDFSKIEAGKLILEEKETDLKGMIQKTFSMITGKRSEKKLDYHLDIDKRIPQCIITDPLRFNQIITNLLSNAIKFTKTGKITLKADLLKQSPTQATVMVSVSDTGIGISPSQKEHIFEMFTQGDSSTTREYGGTGLGLPITVNILERMGTQLDLSSKPGKGSTFSFTCDFKLPR